MKAPAVKEKEKIKATPKADGILIKGARVHNLKDITVEIPRNNLIVQDSSCSEATNLMLII